MYFCKKRMIHVLIFHSSIQQQFSTQSVRLDVLVSLSLHKFPTSCIRAKSFFYQGVREMENLGASQQLPVFAGEIYDFLEYQNEDIFSIIKIYRILYLYAGLFKSYIF